MLYGLKHRDYRTINYTEDLDEAYKFCATHPGYEIIAAEKLKKDIDYNETEFIDILFLLIYQWMKSLMSW